MYDSVTNQTTFLGNTTETYFRISSLQTGHNYTFSVQARCLVSGQLCGEAALLLYDQLTAGTHTLARSLSTHARARSLTPCPPDQEPATPHTLASSRATWRQWWCRCSSSCCWASAEAW